MNMNDKSVVDETRERVENQKTLPEKEKFMSDGKLTVWEFILVSRYFLPLLASVAFIVGIFFGVEPDSFLDKLTMVLWFVGFFSTFTVLSPIKMLKFVGKSIYTCFNVARGFIPVYGLADLIAAIVGFGAGLGFSLTVLMFFPGFFTIKKFFYGDNL